MNSPSKATHDLIDEISISTLKRKIRELEESKANLKQAEKALLQAKGEWERTFDAIPDLIALIDTDHRIIRANVAMSSRLGCTPAQVIGCHCYEAVHGLSAPPDFCPHAKLLTSGKEGQAEVAEDRLGGIFDVSVTPLRNETGQIAGSVHIARDITKRKQAEEMLRLQALVLDQIQDRVTITDLSGVITYVNEAEVASLGYNRDKLIGRNTSVYGEDPEKGARQKDILDKTIENGSWRGEVLNFTADGQEVIMDCRTQVVRDGVGLPIALVGISTDVTENKLLEKESLIDKHNLLTVLDATDDIIILTDASGKVLLYNQTFANRYHHIASDLIGFNIFDLVPMNCRINRRQHFEAARISTKSIVFEDRASDKMWSNAIYPVVNNDATVDRMVLFGRDITEHKQAEFLRDQQLHFAKALNEIAEVIISKDNSEDILENTNSIIGETLRLDRALIYDISFEKNIITGLCEWLGQKHPDIVHTKDEYPLDMFLNPFTEIKKTQKYLESQFNAVNEHFIENGSGKILHEQMKIKSLIWYPFAFDKHGYYVFTLNSILEQRRWTQEEIDFLESAAKQISIALIKIRLLEESKRAEEALRESEELFRTSMERAPDGVYMNDLEGNFLYGNCKAEDIIGYKREELIGRNFLDFNMIAEGSLSKAAELLKANIEGRSTGPDEIEMVSKDGSNILVEITTNLIHRGCKTDVLAFVRNITERKNAEESLQESLARLNRAEKTAKMGNWKLMLNTKEFIGSAGAKTIYGVEKDTISFDDARKCTLPEYIDVLNKGLNDLITKDIPYSLDIKICRPTDGKIMDIHSIAEYDKENNIVYGVIQDITEQKQAAEELRESEERYRAISESSYSAICIVDEQGKITWGNDKMQELGGYSQEQMYGAESFAGFIAPESLEFVISNFQKVIAGEPYEHHYTFNFIRADEEKRLCQKHMMDFKDKRGKRNLIISMVDITDSRRAEDALVNAEEKFRLITENMVDCVALVDASGAYQYVTPSYRETLGYDQKEMLGITGFSITHPDDLERITRLYLEGIEKGWRETIYETRLRHKDGHYVPLEIRTHSLNDTQGKITGGVIAARDITDRKQAQDEKAKFENQLLQSQKMEAIGTLAGGIAHDFNNILAVIIGYAELARDKNQKETKDKYLQEILMGAERARNLVKQILSFSRQGEHTEKKPLDINILLQEAIKFLRASIPATVEIKQSITKESCNIMADPTQMHQIIMNLCTNAAHAMKRIGGIIKIELTALELSEGDIPQYPELQPGHYVKLTVSDTGHGIDSDNIQKIFDPFFTTKSVNEGTGLGLSVVYGIVKSHGGAINVYSEPEQGATFNVYLPRIMQTKIMKGDINKPVIGGTERILFVDDEPLLVDIGIHALSSLGYDVTGIVSSVEALDMVNAEPQRFDLVITDMTLPKMNGIVLSRKILKIRPDIPIILCSGVRESGTEEQAKSFGIRAYIMKPLTKRELARVIREVLGKKAEG